MSENQTMNDYGLHSTQVSDYISLRKYLVL